MDITQTLYFMLPNADSAKNALKEMLRSHIGIGKIHFLGKRGELPSELPEASVFQKTDITHAAKIGILAGGFIGMVSGMAVLLFPPGGLVFGLITVPFGTVLGAVVGVWSATMIGSALPNTKLEAFQPEIEQGKVLMIVDVPQSRVDEISVQVGKNPNAVLRHLDPTMASA
ncbi:MAG TPA: DUF1269 domain-containing protein [Burkholderiales bacterium]|nr:DUF1269 domain-containing protein [Burkholderiales bacterium]